jgi:hypothetical protein
LEHPHRSALENHVHRTPRLGNHGLLNVRIGIRLLRYPAQCRMLFLAVRHSQVEAILA